MPVISGMENSWSRSMLARTRRAILFRPGPVRAGGGEAATVPTSLPSGLLPGVVAVHRGGKSQVERGLDGVGGSRDVPGERALLLGREAGQHPVRGLRGFLGAADPEAQAREETRPQALDHVLETAVTAAAPAGAQSQPPEGQVHVVEDHEQVCGRLGDGKVGDCLRHGVTREVHPGLRLEQTDIGPGESPATEAPAEALLRQRDLAPRSQLVDDPEADVVSRRRVARSRVAETDDEPHAPGYSPASSSPASLPSAAASPSAGAASAPSASSSPSTGAASSTTAGATTDTTERSGSESSSTPSGSAMSRTWIESPTWRALTSTVSSFGIAVGRHSSSTSRSE